MQRDAALIPIPDASVILVASTTCKWLNDEDSETRNVQISHQIGAQSTALLCHTMVFMKRLRRAIAVHIMKRQVPEFQA